MIRFLEKFIDIEARIILWVRLLSQQ